MFVMARLPRCSATLNRNLIAAESDTREAEVLPLAYVFARTHLLRRQRRRTIARPALRHL